MTTPSVSRVQRATPSPSSALSRGAAARNSVPARPTPSSARPLSRRIDSGNESPKPSTRDALEGALRRETEQKEDLILQVQGHVQTVTDLEASNASLRTALQVAETRISELHADQARMEQDMADQAEVIDKLREQMADGERERREEARRYRDQAATFEAERQAFYDNEGHLKGRIAHLQEQLKRRSFEWRSKEAVEDQEEEHEEDEPARPKEHREEQAEQSEPAELISLRMEMETLGGAYSSLQTTHQIIQQELTDLKRVYQTIQEENESYNILLRERTLAGTFDIAGAAGPSYSDEEVEVDDAWSKASGRNLEVVSEDVEFDENTDVDKLDPELTFVTARDNESLPAESVSSQSRRRGTASRSRKISQTGKVESLADLPITGPGLDLAAELGRAQIRDGEDVTVNESPKAKKDDIDHRVVGTLKSEIKSLKEANKALSLYAAKILDRIIAEEGFEHVLAADYGKGEDLDKAVTTPPPRGASLSRSKTVAGHGTRPGMTMSGARDQQQEMFAATPMSRGSSEQPRSQIPQAQQSAQAKRRSMSIDWKGLFGGGTAEKKTENLKPLTLASSATPANAAAAAASARARKLEREFQEDEEDRRERERLNATMKLMGIEGASSLRDREQSVDDLGHLEVARGLGAFGGGESKADRRRTSMLALGDSTPVVQQQPRALSSPFAHTSRTPSDPIGIPTRSRLTSEALAESSAAHALAELDAREKELSEQIAKGAEKGYQSGFTPSPREIDNPLGGSSIMRRASRRKGRDSGARMSEGSVSTVWSAGRASRPGSSVGEDVE